MALSAQRTRIAGISIVVLLVLAALAARLISDRRPVAAGGPPVADDSATPIAASPPPVSADNLTQMRQVDFQVNSRLASDSVPVREQAAEMAMGIGDLWRAETLLRSVLARAHGERHARLLLADVLTQQEKLAPARTLYLDLNREDPHDLAPYLQLQSISVREKRAAEGWQWLARGVVACAQNPEGLTAIARRYYYLNDIAAAERALDRASQTAPGDTGVRIQRAILLIQRSRLEESRAILEDLLRTQPDNETANRLLASILLHPAYPSQDVNRANSLLEHAVALNPKDPEIYRLAATGYRRLHLNRMAAEAYCALLTLDPRSADGRFGLGQVYEQLGLKDLARSQFAVNRRLRDEEEQVRPLSSAVSQRPFSAGAHSALSRRLEQNGDFAGALREAQTAAGLAPGDTAIAAALQALYTRLGWPAPPRSAQ